MNKFDTANYPTTEPAEIVAGDFIAWKRTDLGVDYAPASYTLSYTARLESDPTKKITITASGSGSDFIASAAAATSLTWPVGRYQWQAYITRNSDSERVTVDSGTFEVIANRSLSTADPRSHAKKVLDAIQAVLERRASVDQESYTINGRTLSRTPIADLLVLRDRYKEEVRREEAAEALANGMGDPRRIGIRLRRV